MATTNIESPGTQAAPRFPTWLDLPSPPLDENGLRGIPYPAAGTDWTAHSILDLFRRMVEAEPDRVAVDDGRRQLTRRQIWNGACGLAAAIDAKIPAGPVGILLPNEASYAIAVLACLAAGRPCVVLDRHYPPARNLAIVADAGLAGVIVEPSDIGDPGLYPPELIAVSPDPVDTDAPLAAPPAAAIGADDPAFIIYTSGSTGAPKGIVLGQRAMLHRIGQLIDSLHIGPADVSLPLASPCTIAGTMQLFEALLSGALLLKLDLQRVGLGSVLDAIADKKATLMFATPALLRVMARLDGIRAQLATLRTVHPSGEVLLAADLDLLRACLPAGCKILLVYGLTEAPAICQWFVPHGHAAAGARVAVGYRLPGCNCAIVGSDGEPVGRGQTGELVVRSRFTALGDWRGGRLERGPFTADPADPDLRILATGDLAWVRGDGAIVIVGRKDRQVQIHGMRVEPSEVENVLRRSDGVLDAAVIARHDSELPTLAAFVVLAPERRDAGLGPIWSNLQMSLPAYMHPARITPIDALPLLPGHKVDSEALIALDAALPARTGGHAGAKSPPAAREAVARAWRELLGDASLEADTPLCEAGGDSLGLLQLVFAIEAACAVKLPFASFNICMRPSEVAAAVEDFLSSQPAAPASPAAPGASPLVLLSPGEQMPPIFIAHGLGGHVGELAELGRHLRTGHPLYALQARGIGADEPNERIEDIGQYFCGAIEAAQPNGPYLLIGYSLGGLIMLEVASLLRQHGREVRLLALLDTYPHPRFWPLRPWLSLLAQRAADRGAGTARMPVGSAISRIRALAGNLVEQVAFRLGFDRRPRDLAGAGVAPGLRRMRASLTTAEARYRPRRYPGEIAFFRAEEADGMPQDPRVVWGEVAGRVDVVSVPGGHVSMIFTDALANRLSDRIGKALAPAR